jgi:Tubulin-tyrosine ligase family
MPRIKDLIIDTILSVKGAQLNPSKRKHCFELFGYDFLIDEDFRIWLIEVNTNPYFGIPNEYIADLLPKMIDDMTRLVVDPYFPPKNVEDPKRENLFELLYSEQPENAINKRRPFSLDLLYPIAELK